MTDLRLSWMRDEEGVIVIYATDRTGRKVAVADFWTGPMRQHMGIPGPRAKGIQQQLAETLVENWNDPATHWTDDPADEPSGDGPEVVRGKSDD